jgi:signal transduction histidine kinase
VRVLPKSLFGRLVLVLLVGLLLAQVVTAYINSAERDQLLYRAGGMRLAQQIADIVKLLDSLPDQERRKVVSVFNAPPLAVSLDKPAVAVQEDESESDFQRSMFAAVLRYALGENAKIAVIRSSAATAFLALKGRKGQPGMPGGQHRWGPSMQGYGLGGAFFTVQVALSDGTLATFDSNVSPQDTAMPTRVALTLLVLLATVVVLSLVAVRWVTGPLSALASAAEELGENINRPPMREQGPIEVQRAAKAFNTMQQRLSRYLSDRTRVLAAMSHDLKTPITRLRLRAEMLEDESLKSKFVRDLDDMESMVMQTLEFMRDASDSEPLQPVDVMALLESLRADCEDAGKRVDIEGHIARPCAARPLALRRCLTNLVDNAIRYGKRATIVAEDRAAEIRIRILDEGPGMREEELERAFEPFYRGEESRSRETGGTGLGLGIARNIARAHGGELVLKNRPEGGLEATLVLPAGTAPGTRQAPRPLPRQ